MVTQYINNLMSKAEYEILKDDRTYYGEIPGIQGVWANEKTLTECQSALREVLEEWLLIKLRHNEKVPVIQRINLNAAFFIQSFPRGKEDSVKYWKNFWGNKNVNDIHKEILIAKKSGEI